MPVIRTLILALSLILLLSSQLDDGAVPPQRCQVVTEVPILMYHVIGDNTGPMQELFVSPKVFKQQMQYLKQNGYSTITLVELYNHWKNGLPLPAKPIVLTFDDGYRSVYEEAYPVMKQYGFTGVLFIYVNKFSSGNGMTEAEISELIEHGFEVGCHTYNHLDLTKVSGRQLTHEVVASKAALERMFDIDIVSFCYPAGRYNEQVIEAVRRAGYGIAVTTEYGFAAAEQGLLTLKRIRINRSDGLKGFISKLRR